MTNIDDFNLAVAAIFEELYGKFPHPSMMTPSQIEARIFEVEVNLSSLSRRGGQKSFVANTLIWLKEEGYIRYTAEAGRGAQFAGVVLTQKGFAALSKVPESLATKKPIGDQLLELSKAATKEMMVQSAKQLVPLIFGSALPSAP